MRKEKCLLWPDDVGKAAQCQCCCGQSASASAAAEQLTAATVMASDQRSDNFCLPFFRDY